MIRFMGILMGSILLSVNGYAQEKRISIQLLDVNKETAIASSSIYSKNNKERYSEYWHADQVLMDRAAVAPLYYEKWIWLVNNKVHNLDVSGIGVLDLSKVYFAKDTLIGKVQ